MKRVDTSVPISQHVAEHRETLVRQKERLPELRQRVEKLHGALESCTTRRALRRAVDIRAAIEKMGAEIERLDSDEHIRAFDRTVGPYMEAYVRHSGAPAAKAVRYLVPGEVESRVERSEAGGTQTQSDVVAEYLVMVQGEAPRPRIERSDKCPHCVDTAMVLVPAKAILACPKCGRSASFLDATSQAISYDDTIEMVTFSYKRGSHFQDWLSNVQGLETYEVSQEVIDAVMQELYRQRVTSLDEITTQRVRTILKAMRLRKCYDHVAQIVSRITGRPPPRLPPEASELCRLMFTAVQVPFQKYCPPSRKNFLSYSFILNKILYILGYDELCETLTMLKGQDKLKRMDELWKLITADLDWEWFPSV